MNAAFAALLHNARWELVRLRRSQRVWLLLIPAVAGPIGSVVADLYLRVPSAGTAQVLGLLIAGGLSALVILDLTALAVGEDLARRTEYLTLVLPQRPSWALGGRLAVVVGGSLGAYAVGAVAVARLADALVPATSNTAAPILPPAHLAIGMLGLLLFLGGVTAVAALATRSASQALVAGVLAGVVSAGLASWLLLQGQITLWFPGGLGAVGLAGFAWCLAQFGRIEA